jgi:hypothetical protein
LSYAEVLRAVKAGNTNMPVIVGGLSGSDDAGSAQFPHEQ